MSRASSAIDLAQINRLTETVNVDKNPIIYLSIDPGKYNGICGYDERLYLQFMYTVESKNIIVFLKQFKKIQKCIIEDYRLYPNKAQEQIYSDMETPRVIGMVEAWSQTNDIELIKQGASIKKTGYAWVGQKPPSKKSGKNDPYDAHVHFVYWAVRHNRMNAADLLKKPLVQ